MDLRLLTNFRNVLAAPLHCSSCSVCVADKWNVTLLYLVGKAGFTYFPVKFRPAARTGSILRNVNLRLG
jgi:hypothetical protein